jgi:Metallo-peptidase family M12B Reprolysin-like/Secretion system C-terminal sorting domain
MTILTKFLSKATFVCAFMCCIATVTFAQKNIFTKLTTSSKSLPKAVEKAKNFSKISIIRLDEAALRQYLSTAPLEFQNGGVTVPLDIPLPNGATETFGMVESPILSPEQAVLHPEIKTYTGNGLKNKAYSIRLSLTSSGFNAIILNVENDAVYFEPYSSVDRNYYFSYFNRDATSPKQKGHPSAVCGVESSKNAKDATDNINTIPLQNRSANELLNNTGATLRTYRIAIAATGEFTSVQPGADTTEQKTAAYNAIVAYVNRMIAVYRREVAISFSLVSGENVIYPDKTTDPYSTADTRLVEENQAVMDSIIRTENYDIGHVISQSEGSGEGLAATPSACDEDFKASGVTKIGDIDDFAQVFFDQALFHEVGHQFSAKHSYNSSIPVCTTRSQGTSVEPGSGTTIMSYGFTCADTMGNSDDYFDTPTPKTGPFLNFHTANYAQIVAYVSTAGCGTSTATGNSAPVVTEPANRTIPKSTPFSLTGTATDPDEDALTYSWEGTNTGEVAAPVFTTLADTTKPPFFRSYEPSATGATRTYPILSAILDGTNHAKGDKLPAVAFVTTHRLTVRDNKTGTAYKEVTVTIDGDSGPFLETTNLSDAYLGNSVQNITWSVNNTDAAPVNCANVKISLSTDGGLTFPTVLLASTPNDGSANITFPDVATTTARIKVEAIDNIFFDISNEDFVITSALPIELIDLSAKLVGKTTHVNWRTGSELNSLGFDVERSIDDGRTFKKIGFVKAIGRGGSYDFVDVTPREGVNYYRLKSVDNDQTFAYSKVVTVQLGKVKSSIKIYPTITNGVLTVENKDAPVDEVLIYNYVGQLVLSAQQTNSVNLSNLPSGVYFVKAQSGQDDVVEKILKQ